MRAESDIVLSVRELVGFSMRSGDLVVDFAGGSRALAGTLGHQKVQRSRPDNYIPELSLSITFERRGLRLTVQGRADGMYIGTSPFVIDEIKTTNRALDDLGEDDRPEHWAQARIYAFIYAIENAQEAMDVQLSYYQLDEEETREFRRSYSLSELQSFFDSLVDAYLDWAEKIREWALERNLSLSAALFPFDEYRAGQREMAVEVYKCIRSGNRLFAQAPTGIGKTMAAIFPAVKALGEGKFDKIFYLTAKTIGRQAAEKAFGLLREKGLKVKTLTLTAKDKICFEPGAACRPEECEYAAGYFDRVPMALEEIFEHDCFDRPTVEACARAHRICPFEFSLDLAYWVDAIICDYNYVFDPRVYLRRFFDDDNFAICLLIDEAHNLVDRARGMYSAELFKQDFLDLNRQVKGHWRQGSSALAEANRQLLEIKKICEGEERGRLVQKEAPAYFTKILRRFTWATEKWLVGAPRSELREAVLAFYFKVLGFLRTEEIYGERHVSYFEIVKRKNLYARLFCMDPSEELSRRLEKVQATIFFSATLTPLDYFKQLLGGSEEDVAGSLPSPFPPENLALLVHHGVATNYKQRAESYDEVAHIIREAAEARVGNILIYFPSYLYMEEIHSRFTELVPEVRTLLQSRDMSEPEREAFLENFVAPDKQSMVAFAVMGGIFGEGIDLVGERLSGVVVIGVGLPQVCLERDLIRDFFEETEKSGFAYAYRYPGMNRVLQAAGRLIRTEEDRGFVLLVDERFSQARYRRLFPPWWETNFIRRTEGIRTALENFWGEDKKD